MQLDGGTFEHNGAISGGRRMRQLPEDGTYLRIHPSGGYARIAGGAALEVTDCAPLDGQCQGTTWIDSGTLDRGGAISGRPATSDAR